MDERAVLVVVGLPVRRAFGPLLVDDAPASTEAIRAWDRRPDVTLRGALVDRYA